MQRGSPTLPSAAISAVISRVASQGMSGWSQTSQASRRPSGERRGIGEEVVAGGEGQGVAAGERHGHQPVLGLAARPVLLEDGHHPVPYRVDQRLREAQRPARRRADRPAAAIGIEAPEPLVLVVDQHDRAGVRREAGAAILVQPGADVDRGRGPLDGGVRPRRIEAQEGDPAALVGPALEQQQPVAVQGELAEPVLLAGDGSGADRRRPAAIGASRASKGQGQHLVGIAGTLIAPRIAGAVQPGSLGGGTGPG
jgi:hypothetical protein